MSIKEKDLVAGQRYVWLDSTGRGEAVTYMYTRKFCYSWVFVFQADKFTGSICLKSHEIEKQIRFTDTKPKKGYLNPRAEKEEERWDPGKLGNLEKLIGQAVERLEELCRGQNLIPEYDFYNWDYESWDLNGWHDTYSLVLGHQTIFTATHPRKINRIKSAKIFLSKIEGAIKILEHFRKNQPKD